MSLWYDLKKNSYATNGKEGWIKSHFDHAMEQKFSECSLERDRLYASLETEKAEREEECGEIRAEVQSELLTRDEIISGIREDITPVLSLGELKEVTLNEKDKSVLCINAEEFYFAEGLEFVFRAPRSKSEISRIDLTLSISIGDEDINLMSEVEEVESPDPDTEVDLIPLEPDLTDPDGSIEEPEPVVPTEKVESFYFESGKDFEEGNYVTVLFSGTKVEVKEVYQSGYFDFRISDNARNINTLYRYCRENSDENFDNWCDIRDLKDKTEELEEFRDGLIAGVVGANGIVLCSSTEGSNKRFNLTIDDNGTITVAEMEV